MKLAIFLGTTCLTVVAFAIGFKLGNDVQARALEGCEVVAAQASRDAMEAEGKASACDEIFKNIGSLDEGIEP